VLVVFLMLGAFVVFTVMTVAVFLLVWSWFGFGVF